MDIISPQDWTFPVPIQYGPNRIAELASLCQMTGMTRPLLVTDRGSADLPFVADILAQLKDAGMEPGIFADISPNPRDTEIIAGRSAYRDAGHDGIIALGGGSGMDGGKAISLVANNECDIWDFEYERPSPELGPENAFPPLICIPTTAGTGAETESTAMVTDTEQMMKWCIWHPDQKPDAVILDPVLTIGLPHHLTAWTGVDAMVHAIEGYLVKDFHPLCDGAALEALRLINRYLEAACTTPDDLEARGGMLVGSCLGGIAFLKGLGLVHAISHMVGAEYDTHHGLTNAVLLPAVMQFNAPEMTDKLPAMALALGLQNPSFDSFHAFLCDMLDRLDIPRTLTDIGVPDDGIDRLAAKSLRDSAAGTNPRHASQDEVEAIIREALTRGR